MSELKTKPVEIKLNNVSYGLSFTINAIDEIQDHYDKSIEDLAEILSDQRKIFSNLRYLLTILINENVDIQNDNGANLKHVTEKYVGRYINTNNLGEFSNAIFMAFSKGSPQSDEESPNEVTE